MLEAESAEWMAIISECMESGVLTRWPPPLPEYEASKGLKVGEPSSEETKVLFRSVSRFNLYFDFIFPFSSHSACPSNPALLRRPLLRAPPEKPLR